MGAPGQPRSVAEDRYGEVTMLLIPAFLRNRNITTQVMLPVLVILAVTVGVLVAYLRHTSREQTVQQAQAEARNLIQQYEILRAYYSTHVVAKVREKSNLEIS